MKGLHMNNQKTPPFLTGTTLLFWGWQSEFLLFGKDNLVTVGNILGRMYTKISNRPVLVVQVDQLGMIGHYAVVVLAGVVVLDEVIPGMPLPHDVG